MNALIDALNEYTIGIEMWFCFGDLLYILRTSIFIESFRNVFQQLIQQRIYQNLFRPNRLTAYRHLETYAEDKEAGMLLIHILVSFSLLISVMRHDVRCGRAKATPMTLIRRLKETKKCIRDMPAPVSGAYVSRCLLAVIGSLFTTIIIAYSFHNLVDYYYYIAFT